MERMVRHFIVQIGHLDFPIKACSAWSAFSQITDFTANHRGVSQEWSVDAQGDTLHATHKDGTVVTVVAYQPNDRIA